MQVGDSRFKETIDFKTETTHARLVQFKRDRWTHVIGHVGATLAVICVAWPVADHAALLLFGVVHHLATWALALTFYFPLRSEHVKRIPWWTYLGAIVGNATLGSALLFDLAAARELTYTLTVGIVLFAGVAGSLFTLGLHSTLLRVAVTSLLFPFIVTALYAGHVAVALGTLFFCCNVVMAGIWKLSIGQAELIVSRIDASHRAEVAERDAETDHLTGLVNRRGVDRLDGMELPGGAAALYFDVNKFKAINDTYGHSVGDEILRVVGQRLRGAVSVNDVVARLGGDEFLILILGQDASSVDTVATRISQQLRHPVSVSGGHLLEVSAAVGYSYCNGPILKLDELLRVSDHAMYQSKETSPLSLCC